MTAETDNRLIVDVTRLDPEGERLEGEVDCVDLDEEFVKSFGPLRYRLDLKLFGTELLVRGALEQDFDLVCSRCGKDYDDTIHVDDFTTSLEVGEGVTEIDLTDELRESVILELPTYPRCDENCAGIEMKSSAPADDRWSALDALK